MAIRQCPKNFSCLKVAPPGSQKERTMGAHFTRYGGIGKLSIGGSQTNYREPDIPRSHHHFSSGVVTTPTQLEITNAEKLRVAGTHKEYLVPPPHKGDSVVNTVQKYRPPSPVEVDPYRCYKSEREIFPRSHLFETGKVDFSSKAVNPGTQREVLSVIKKRHSKPQEDNIAPLTGIPPRLYMEAVQCPGKHLPQCFDEPRETMPSPSNDQPCENKEEPWGGCEAPPWVSAPFWWLGPVPNAHLVGERIGPPTFVELLYMKPRRAGNLFDVGVEAWPAPAEPPIEVSWLNPNINIHSRDTAHSVFLAQHPEPRPRLIRALS